ncbi:hypothetical protein Gotur_033856 [Gossypium turneri]
MHYSSILHLKRHFPSDLHKKPVKNCLSFQGITFIHALHIRLEFAPRNIAILTPSRQSHEPLIHSYSITVRDMFYSIRVGEMVFLKE